MIACVVPTFALHEGVANPSLAIVPFTHDIGADWLELDIPRAFADVRALSRAFVACPFGRGSWAVNAIQRVSSMSPLACKGRFAWQAWGIVDDVCVKRTVDVHFARPAWESGRMSALGKALDSGSAWQAWGIAQLDVAQHAFRVAGVGQRAL